MTEIEWTAAELVTLAAYRHAETHEDAREAEEDLRAHIAAREAQAAAKVEAERDDLLEQRDDLYESLAARTKDVNRMLAEREQHDLANGGCVPAPAYRDLAAEYHRERATVARVEALADRLAQIHNRLHGDVEINRQEHRRGERDLARWLHDDLRAALALPQNHPRSAAGAPEAPGQPGRDEDAAGGRTDTVTVTLTPDATEFMASLEQVERQFRGRRPNARP